MALPSYPGLYRGIVQDNTSKTLMVSIPQLFGLAFIAARSCLPPDWDGDLPALDSMVWVAFEGGEGRFPVWLGVVS